MATKKIAITIPHDVVSMVDEASNRLGISRSKYISSILKDRLEEEKGKWIRESYDQVFADETVQQEQLDTAKWYESSGQFEGQEW